jgi:hypothetical protein
MRMHKSSRWTPALVFVPFVLLLAGVPFFSGSGRIWVFPQLAFWFFLWVVLAPCFVFVADRLRTDEAGGR